MSGQTTVENAAAAAGHGAEASGAGMPQLDFSTFPNQIFWLVVTLVVIYFVLSRIALPRIAAVLAERADTISNDIAAADELKRRAVEAEAAYEKALADARHEANAIVAEAKVQIQSELNAELARADQVIAAKAAESEAAIAEIRKDAVKSVTTISRTAAKQIVAAFGGDAEAAEVNAAVAAQMKG